LRIDQRVGSLEVGKDADVVIWNHHPLSSYAIADRVDVDGTLYYDRDAETTRLTQLQKEKETLVAAERSEPRLARHLAVGCGTGCQQYQGNDGCGSSHCVVSCGITSPYVVKTTLPILARR
jgi:hypothetical protein